MDKSQQEKTDAFTTELQALLKKYGARLSPRISIGLDFDDAPKEGGEVVQDNIANIPTPEV